METDRTVSDLDGKLCCYLVSKVFLMSVLAKIGSCDVWRSASAFSASLLFEDLLCIAAQSWQELMAIVVLDKSNYGHGGWEERREYMLHKLGRIQYFLIEFNTYIIIFTKQIIYFSLLSFMYQLRCLHRI